MGYPVVHFDVIGTDGEALRKFYGELYGWSIQMMEGSDYGLVGAAPEGIGGGIGSSPDGSTGVTVYIAVPDLGAAIKKIESLGGKQVGDVVDMPGIVTFVMFADPQGNVVGLVKDDGTQAPLERTETLPVAWFEILGTDGPSLRDFYGKAFGWGFDVSEGPVDYGQVDTKSEGHGIPGGVGKSQGEPIVTVYAAVDDLQKYLDRAESLGATPVMQPTEVGAGTTIAVFKDPSGNVFGMFKHVHPH